MSSIESIFIDIYEFVHDYVKTIEKISNKNILIIELANENFYLPATWNDYSKRADELQNQLQKEIRNLAQDRRHKITQGIRIADERFSKSKQFIFDQQFKHRLEQLKSDKNLQRIRMIIDAFEVYNELEINHTFRLLPILSHIEKQLCCLSKNLQNLLDNQSSIIENHLKIIQQKIVRYNQEMKSKLAEYIARDVRPPVLVVPCRNDFSR